MQVVACCCWWYSEEVKEGDAEHDSIPFIRASGVPQLARSASCSPLALRRAFRSLSDRLFECCCRCSLRLEEVQQAVRGAAAIGRQRSGRHVSLKIALTAER